MDLMKKNLAPIADEAWDEIEKQAQITLKGNLSARGLVDFDGPHGWKKASVNLGRAKLAESGVIEGVLFGKRDVQPLIETRVNFALDLKDLDDVERGLKTPDLEPLIAACRKAAQFEEKAVYLGFEKGGIAGIFKSSEHTPIKIKNEAKSFAKSIEEAVVALQKGGIGGPHNLVLGTALYQTLMEGESGYPLKKRVDDIIRGKIAWSPALKGGALISGRGGDFIFTVGQDLSLGYAGHTAEKVNLFIAESFTFQVIEPKAAIEIALQ
jgi:uncharacterized linocin/CFP29 family protein